MTAQMLQLDSTARANMSCCFRRLKRSGEHFSHRLATQFGELTWKRKVSVLQAGRDRTGETSP